MQVETPVLPLVQKNMNIIEDQQKFPPSFKEDYVDSTNKIVSTVIQQQGEFINILEGTTSMTENDTELGINHKNEQSPSDLNNNEERNGKVNSKKNWNNYNYNNNNGNSKKQTKKKDWRKSKSIREYRLAYTFRSQKLFT